MRGLYVHVPFCKKKCDFCAFVTYENKDYLIDAYLKAVIKCLQRIDLSVFDTLYFGGGTPSILGSERISSILSIVGKKSEVTVECHPDDITQKFLKDLRSGGVTRLSLGIEAIDQEVLKDIGREKPSRDIFQVVSEIIDTKFDVFSIDLIFGSRKESVDLWISTLEKLAGIVDGPNHMSIYSLTVENGTPLKRDSNRHPIERDLALKYKIADQILAGYGFSWEEISNFSKANSRSIHNGIYWSRGEYLGVGVGAHSFHGGVRSKNVSNIERFIEKVNKGESVVVYEESITHESKVIEETYLALRTPKGISRDSLFSSRHAKYLEKYFELNSNAVLNVDGRLIADEIFSMLDVRG